jgi:ribosome-binding factor A
MDIGFKRIGLQQRSLDLQGQQIEAGAQDAMARLALGVGDLVLNAGSTIYNIVKQGQMEKAKAGVLQLTAEYNVLNTKSILNNKSGFIKNEQTQELEWRADPELEQWKQNRIKSIQENGTFSEVRDFALAATQEVFNAGQERAVATAVSHAQKTANESFMQTLDAANLQDLQSPTGSEISDKAIRSNPLLNKDQQEVAINANRAYLAMTRATNTVQANARDNGLPSAMAYLNDNRSQYTNEQMEALKTVAVKASAEGLEQLKVQAKNTVLEEMDSGRNPKEIFKSLEERVKGQPTDRKEAIIKAARDAQTSRAVDRGMKQWNEDEPKTLDELKAQRKSINTGALSHQYDGIPETKEAILNYYDRAIASLSQGMGDGSTKPFDFAPLLANIRSGTVSAYDALEYGKSKAGENVENAKGFNSFYETVKKEIVPAQFKSIVDDYTKRIQPAITSYFGKSKTDDLSKEQKDKLYAASAWYEGAVLDMFIDSASKDLNLATVEKNLKSFAEIYTSKELDALKTGYVPESGGLFGIGTKGGIDNAFEMATRFQAIDPVFIDMNGAVNWASPEMRQTFEQVSLALAGDLEKRGVKLDVRDGQKYTLLKDGPNDVLPIPVFHAADGKKYRYEGKILWESKDGNSWSVSSKPAPASPTAAPTVAPGTYDAEIPAGTSTTGGLKGLTPPPAKPKTAITPSTTSTGGVR